MCKVLDQKYRVVLVERNDSHYFQAGYPLLIINKRRPGQASKRVTLLAPTRPAYWAKVAFEKYWLYRWF